MKQHYSISPIQLNYLIVASESGRVFGFFLSVATVDFLPPSLILSIGLIFRFIGHGEQYLCMTFHVDLSYWQVLLLNFLAGNSFSWINTYGSLLASKNFKNDGMSHIFPMASSFSWLTGKIYSSLIESIQGKELDLQGQKYCHTHMLFNCIAPTMIGAAIQLIFMFAKDGDEEIDMVPIILILIGSGLYIAFESLMPPLTRMPPQLRLVIMVLVIVLPLVTTIAIASEIKVLKKYLNSNSKCDEVKEVAPDQEKVIDIISYNYNEEEINKSSLVNGDEKGIALLSVEFWLLYLVNACGATLGVGFMNNLRHICVSYGDCEQDSILQAIPTTFGFFGSILSAIFIWRTRENAISSKPSTMSAILLLLMIPMPVAFFLLIVNSGSPICFYISTAIIGTCAGAMSCMTTPTISQMFGPEYSVISQTIFLTNYPIGTLIFGYLAAVNQEPNGVVSNRDYTRNFVFWELISLVGTISSFCLFLRIRLASRRNTN
ncbi:protein NUCLEAR FUSION DEFECTIVE 4-like [Rutidosis leptorrhynchoides]|uniref:protein NUCLEAR FUSION DEFECTIVE 4-like n=1 Tax=Rutidosis leptorrhynchoides TaxID=125765 RepID=UPI003A99FA8E